MNRKKIIFAMLAVVGLLASGCQSSNQPATEKPVVEETTSAPVSTNTAIPNTETATVTITPTWTNTPTETASPTWTITPTPLPPRFKLIMNGICYKGPGYGYDIDRYILEGAEFIALGINEDASWVLLDMGNGEKSCWIPSDRFDESLSDYNLKSVEAPPTPTMSPTATPQQKGLRFYLIRLNTGGPFGCGDSLVYFYTGIKSKGSLEDSVTDILRALFKSKKQFIGKDYNPVYKSNLSVKSVSVNYAAHSVDVHLKGTFVKPKDACESKRMRAQIWNTILQFDEINSLHIWVNNKLLGDLLYVGNK